MLTLNLVPSSVDEFRDTISGLSERVNDHLETVLPSDSDVPRTLLDAMSYSVNAGGKRLRPILTLVAYSIFRDDFERVLTPACAIELIHTYSLIHDDLPCMDDDDLRRGKPTLHRQFNEAIAVLAGDALHALAFELLAQSGNSEVLHQVAVAIGTSGMLGGQVADLESEGADVTLQDVEYIHLKKTGALLQVALKIGAILADAPKESVKLLGSYGEKIGLAFQITDDILDLTGSEEKLGKDLRSDEKNSKATYPKVIGLDESRNIAENLIADAKQEIVPLGDKATILNYLADFILSREH